MLWKVDDNDDDDDNNDCGEDDNNIIPFSLCTCSVGIDYNAFLGLVCLYSALLFVYWNITQHVFTILFYANLIII